MAEKNNKIELWEGYEVEVDTSLLDDVSFVADLNDARVNNDFNGLISMYFAMIGGQSTYNTVQEHFTNEEGRFTIQALNGILEKINSVLPKVGNRATQRLKMTTR